MNIPLTYLVFLVSCFLIWKPEYISLLNISSWVPENIKEIIFGISNLVYSNIILIMIVLIICMIGVSLLAKYTNIFEKILPKDVEYTNDTVVMWNEYSAIRRILSIITNLIMPLFVYYFTLNVLFNPYNFIENFFKKSTFQVENELINGGYLTENTLSILNIFFGINVFYTVFLVLRALFEIRVSTNKSFLEANNLKLYIKVNSFSEKNELDEEFETIILKSKYGKRVEFLLVNVQLYKRYYKPIRYGKECQWIVDKVPPGEKFFNILDRGENLPDIVYHFDILKEKTLL